MEEQRTVEFNGEQVPVHAGKQHTHLLIYQPLKKENKPHNSKLVHVEQLIIPRDEGFLERTKKNYDEWGIKYLVVEL